MKINNNSEDFLTVETVVRIKESATRKIPHSGQKRSGLAVYMACIRPRQFVA